MREETSTYKYLEPRVLNSREYLRFYRAATAGQVPRHQIEVFLKPALHQDLVMLVYLCVALAQVETSEARLLPQSDAYRIFSIQPERAASIWAASVSHASQRYYLRLHRCSMAAALEVDVFLQLALDSTRLLPWQSVHTEAEQWRNTSIA